MRRSLLVGLASAALLAGCGGEGDALVVSAASSLTEAFTEVAAAFEAAHPDVEVRLNFGSSAALAAQIAEGAPVDVFASADLPQIEAALAAGRGDAYARFADNRLVVVAPAESSTIGAFEDVARPGVRLVIAGGEAPAGRYAREALAAAGLDAALGNVLSEEANVRAVLTRVALGEADAGFVYATDAHAAGDSIRTIEVPAEFAPPVAYFIAALADAPPLTRTFVDFVRSSEGARILERHGFASPAMSARR